MSLQAQSRSMASFEKRNYEIRKPTPPIVFGFPKLAFCSTWTFKLRLSGNKLLWSKMLFRQPRVFQFGNNEENFQMERALFQLSSVCPKSNFDLCLWFSIYIDLRCFYLEWIETLPMIVRSKNCSFNSSLNLAKQVEVVEGTI